MIIKSLSRTSKGAFRPLLTYIFLQSNGALRPVLSRQHLEGHDIGTWTRAFERNEKGRKHRRRRSVRLYHEIISFAPKDREHLSDEVLRTLVGAYLKKRAPEAIAVSAVHREREHVHVHCAISGVSITDGRSTRISRNDFTRIKKEVQHMQIERFPQLRHSRVEHGRGKRRRISEAEFALDKKAEKGSIKTMLVKRIKEVLQKARDMAEFQRDLIEQSLTPYRRGGRLCGIVHDGRKYRFRTLGLLEEVRMLERGRERLR